MKILIVRQWKGFGGAEKYSISLAKGLLDRGQEPYICGCEKRFMDIANKEGIRTIRVPNIFFTRLYKRYRDINIINLTFGIFCVLMALFIIIRYRIGLIHLQGLYDIYFGIAGKALNRKVVFTEHADLTTWYTMDWGYQRFLRNLAIKCIDHIITVSNYCKQFLINKGVCGYKITTIYNGIEISDSGIQTPRFDIKDKIIIGTVSRLDTPKGIEYLLESIKILNTSGLNIECRIIGDGPLEEEYKRYARKLDIQKKVKFLGFQEGIDNYIRSFSIFICPSESETFGFSILEAMKNGIPVIATDVGGVPELISNGIDGILVPPRDPKAIAEAILDLIKDPAKSRVMCGNAYNKVKNNFSISKMVDRTVGIYKIICE